MKVETQIARTRVELLTVILQLAIFIRLSHLCHRQPNGRVGLGNTRTSHGSRLQPTTRRVCASRLVPVKEAARRRSRCGRRQSHGRSPAWCHSGGEAARPAAVGVHSTSEGAAGGNSISQDRVDRSDAGQGGVDGADRGGTRIDGDGVAAGCSACNSGGCLRERWCRHRCGPSRRVRAWKLALPTRSSRWHRVAPRPSRPARLRVQRRRFQHLLRAGARGHPWLSVQLALACTRRQPPSTVREQEQGRRSDGGRLKAEQQHTLCRPYRTETQDSGILNDAIAGSCRAQQPLPPAAAWRGARRLGLAARLQIRMTISAHGRGAGLVGTTREAGDNCVHYQLSKQTRARRAFPPTHPPKSAAWLLPPQRQQQPGACGSLDRLRGSTSTEGQRGTAAKHHIENGTRCNTTIFDPTPSVAKKVASKRCSRAPCSREVRADFPTGILD